MRKIQWEPAELTRAQMRKIEEADLLAELKDEAYDRQRQRAWDEEQRRIDRESHRVIR